MFVAKLVVINLLPVVLDHVLIFGFLEDSSLLTVLLAACNTSILDSILVAIIEICCVRVCIVILLQAKEAVLFILEFVIKAVVGTPELSGSLPGVSHDIKADVSVTVCLSQFQRSIGLLVEVLSLHGAEDLVFIGLVRVLLCYPGIGKLLGEFLHR